MSRYRPPRTAGTPLITPEGAARLRAELHELWHVRRPQVTQAVSEAAALGDRSENAEYIYGKKMLREIDSRVRFLRKRLENTFFLVPGYGAQGGKAEDIAQYLTKGNGGVVNSSRGILLAYKKQPGTAFDEAAYNECVNMKEAIAHACSLL